MQGGWGSAGGGESERDAPIAFAVFVDGATYSDFGITSEEVTLMGWAVHPAFHEPVDGEAAGRDVLAGAEVFVTAGLDPFG
jgi:hypothetical protein